MRNLHPKGQNMKTPSKALIIRYTADEPKTALELAELVGIAKRNINQNLKQLIDLDLIKIVGHVPNSPGHPSPLYSSSIKRSVKSYVKSTASENTRRYRQRNKALINARKGKQVMGVTL